MVEFTDTPAMLGRTYDRVEVEGPPTDYPQVPRSMALSGNMVGLSNPIYFNFDPNFETAQLMGRRTARISFTANDLANLLQRVRPLHASELGDGGRKT
jgi:hypothetical protein